MKTAFFSLLVVILALGPSMAQQPRARTAPELPKDFERGLRVTLEASKELGIDDDPSRVKRLNDIAYRVARRAAPEEMYYSFRIAKMEEPNAFALPGGFIFVTSGMLNLDLTDDELAALLGHEITHVRNNHIGRMTKRQTLMNLIYQGLVIGLALGIRDGGTAYDPVTGYPTRSTKGEVIQGTAAFGLIFQELLLRGFSRDLELEADEGGTSAAAGAGYSPKGTTQLFEKMRRKTYELPGYGYWRTHPYLEERSSISRSRAANMEPSQNPPDEENYRKQTQDTFLDYVKLEKTEEGRMELRKMALNAYPHGKAAQEIRWWFIQRAETEEFSREPFFRDYGKLIRLCEVNMEEAKQDAEPAEFIGKLQQKAIELRELNEETLPLYEEILRKGMFDTEMLERYVSNYPNESNSPEVRFRLAENYRILNRNQEAVRLYLQLLDSDSEWVTEARKSLIRLLPNLKDLTSAHMVIIQSKDPELKKSAIARMEKLSGSFEGLENGYEFRRKFPENDYQKAVSDRMSKLGGETLNRGKLYQAVGEYQKALDEYNKILRYCSDLPVADQVRETIVSFQEIHSVKG